MVNFFCRTLGTRGFIRAFNEELRQPKADTSHSRPQTLRHLAKNLLLFLLGFKIEFCQKLPAL